MNLSNGESRPRVAVIGGGPAGLMAAETLMASGLVRVDLYDAMPSLARKFLMAGKGGLNLTHAEPFEQFITRYGERRALLQPALQAFDAAAVRSWASGLGNETFVGSSGRVFPVSMKAAPLLRAWLHRLREGGVHIHVRHRWCGWTDVQPGKPAQSKEAAVGVGLRFVTPNGLIEARHDSAVLAMGGGSWARLGSDGAWVSLLDGQGVPVAPLRPANCGFDVAGFGWTSHFSERFAGEPVKSVQVRFVDARGAEQVQRGEFLITESGVEGSLVYALSAALRDMIGVSGSATLYVDLLPDHELPRVLAEIRRPRGSRSLSSHLQSRLGLRGVKAGLLREVLQAEDFAEPERLAFAIKNLPLRLGATRPLDEAISSAGGVDFAALDEHLMIRALPGIFCAGEMLDWEAPTGGYLLTACFATGHAAARGVLHWIKSFG